MDKLPHISILWTGGFDSSYRMVQLSRHAVTIQPYYLRDRRRSEQNELNAISEITRDILDHPGTKCSILPLITIEVRDIPADREISDAYHRLKNTTTMGKQYEWLSRFSKEIPGIELCIEADGPGREATRGPLVCILKHGQLKRDGEGVASCHVIDESDSSLDLIRVFGRFRFPVVEITKKEMVEEYRKLGFETTMHKTWFCYKPVRNRPCGGCFPCVAAIEEGMQFRFSKAALERYRYRSRYLYVLHRIGILEKLLFILPIIGMTGMANRIGRGIRQPPR